MKRIFFAAAFAALASGPVLAAGTYDPGATDTTIKLGNTFPYSGPVSPTSPQVRQMTGYFNFINDQGGVNGRKIDFVSLDDGYIPPKTVELTRRLVEQDQVLAMFGSEGTPTQMAVRSYLTARKIPQLFVLTGSTSLIDAEEVSVDDGLAGELRGRGGGLGQIYPCREAQRQDRHLLPG